MLERTIKSRNSQNNLTPEAGELRLLHCTVACWSNLSIITEKVLGALNKNLLRSKRAYCMAKQKEQEATQSKQLLHEMVARTESKFEGQLQKSKPNHFSIFKGQVQKCSTAEEISQVAVTARKNKQAR